MVLRAWSGDTEEEQKKWEYMLNQCETEGRNISAWELSFLESLRDQFDRTHSLSERQKEILERIYVDKV
jgi:hypothetical protein